MSIPKENLSLKKFNTFGIDVAAREIIYLRELNQLDKISNLKDCLIIGGGSNILLTKDIDKQVIINKTKGICTVNEDEFHIELAVASGEDWHKFVMYCIQKGYGGIENMSLIPGSVGAAPMQNIGAYGREIKDVLTYVNAVNLNTKKIERFTNKACEFGYRDSIFKKSAKGKYFIADIGIRLTKKDHQINTSYGDIENWLYLNQIKTPTIQDVSNAVIAIRKNKLPNPAELGNSGSFFKNPVISASHYKNLLLKFPEIKSYPVNDEEVKVPAGWLIESLGWKGKRVGNTGAHNKQALVLVNYGNAMGYEVQQLSEDIKKSVWETYQIKLETEVNII
ncbi:MAG: UDP-N-acetylmuramate dehydrogenase [Bacteroidia bacterium]|nr:UDP-N-acetylmuramate dehydrogenase [Bacteroidia bacterium]|tara:strand:+ start:44 stop:1051 length:1008 start_codon:yes stop_codon:yes gene_type:complete